MTENYVKHPNEVVLLVEKKMSFFQDVIQKTILHIQKNKMYDILGISDVNMCISILQELNDKIVLYVEEMNITSTDNLILNLQNINNELSSILKNYGTESLEDILSICFGNNNSTINNDLDVHKYDLLKRFFHPTGYKVANLKKPNSVDNQEDIGLYDKSKNLDCYDISFSVKQFHTKVYGIKVFFYNANFKKNLMIYGILDDVIIDFLNNKYLNSKKTHIMENLPNEAEFHNETFASFLSVLTLKDYLIYSHNEIYNKYAGFLSNVNILKQKSLANLIKEFTNNDMFNKRLTLIHLLIKSTSNYDNQYLAYLLYDLLSNDTNGNIDTQEQIVLFDSFPWVIKKCFRDAMKRTIQYTNDLSNFDMNKIPLEQQICLMKVNDHVKEKAMIKLKEIKAKSEDSGTKARQYLDGLLKIPFGIYRREPILNMMATIKSLFVDFLKNNKEKQNITPNNTNNTNKDTFTSMEIINFMNQYNKGKTPNVDSIKNNHFSYDRKMLINYIIQINNFIKTNSFFESIKNPKLAYNGKTKTEMKDEITSFMEKCPSNVLIQFQESMKPENKSANDQSNIVLNNNTINNNTINNNTNSLVVEKDVKMINENLDFVKKYINEITGVLDNAAHGHDKAKKKIQHIIGQWINGEQDGYCFGFEGPPGVGKTTIAKKGLSNCLKDEDGVSRPFAMIAMGGDSNGSTLHGHNYTYVGSTWGSIVQILIDKKCMNPIIFIDELDKISKTEHGKEIVGILTHLLDPTQNDSFQDKYFSGIDLDLSKVLFILSYNDVELIDKILLDRIHRIKFSSLSLEDKLIISNSHILPEVYKKMGLEDMISIDNETLKIIIEEYTSEPGVRKLKEVLFEIIGEINLELLKNTGSIQNEIPLKITIDDLKNKYLKDRTSMKHKKIHEENKIGHINGMWANAVGQGGIIPIQTKFYPASKFLDLKLTGMQGDVMKESMNVALTLAWDLTRKEIKEELKQEHLAICSGVHIHCPEGAVPKDGPSAGAAITSVIYSLFNNKKIKHNFAITGEITLDGQITEIGGLDLKILGGIKAGVTEFIYPCENQKDFNSFFEKYKNIINIKFYAVDRIEEVFNLIFEDI